MGLLRAAHGGGSEDGKSIRVWPRHCVSVGRDGVPGSGPRGARCANWGPRCRMQGETETEEQRK